MSSQHAFVSRRKTRRANSPSAMSHAVESLESRTLLSATETAPVSPVQLAPSTSSTAIDLSQHFTDPTITGTPVVIDTSQGVIPVELLDTVAPKTVANFLSYANAKAYDTTVIQRAVPGFILQGGGFNASQNHIPTTTPVPNEFSTSNKSGTIAMALSTDPNTHLADPASATSDWFINDADNSATLDPQKFTVFGNVLYDGMTVVNRIEALPKGSVSPSFLPAATDPSSGVLPLQGYNTGSPILTANYVLTNTIVEVQRLSFTVTSDNSSLVTGAVNGANLTITAGAGTGLAHLTITATDLGGNKILQVLPVQVGATQVTLGAGAARSVNFVDPDGTRSQISFTGSGLATVSFTGLNLTVSGSASAKTLSGAPLAVTVTTTGTSAANSNITITGTGGTNKAVDIAGMTINGSVRSIVGRNTNLTASLTLTGSVSTLTLGTVTSSNINVGAGAPIRFTVGAMNTASIFATNTIASVTASSWTGGGVITATTIGQVRIKSSFVGGFSSKSLSSFSAASIGAGLWNISGAVGSITAKGIAGWQATLGSIGRLMNLGAMTSSRISTTGNIASITAASVDNTTILAAVPSGVLPSSNSDFATKATIGSLIVKGAYVNSNVAAANFKTLTVGPITTANNGTVFGIGALTIKTFKFAVGSKKITLRNVVAEEQVTNVLAALAIAPQNLAIRIL